MANEFREHVWIIDTASAGNITDDDVRIDSVRWVISAGASGAEQVAIADGTGSVVWSEVVSGFLGSYAGSDGVYSSESRVPICVRGFRVPVLDRGRLFIYFDLGRGRG